MAGICLIGLDPPESKAIASRLGEKVMAHVALPRAYVCDGELFVEKPNAMTYAAIDRVVFHGIYGNDLDLIAGLALWGGQCLPNAHAMMDCRLKLPCLVRALKHSRFGEPLRGFVSEGASFPTEAERVAKWGNWHCGENKARFEESWHADEAAIIEHFMPGKAVRIFVMGDQAWQVNMDGDDWLKSIHHENAHLTDIDEALLADTRATAAGFGLEIAANDYIITEDRVPHLLEVNHIPNVTEFPEIREAYIEYVVNWLKQN